MDEVTEAAHELLLVIRVYFSYNRYSAMSYVLAAWISVACTIFFLSVVLETDSVLFLSQISSLALFGHNRDRNRSLQYRNSRLVFF